MICLCAIAPAAYSRAWSRAFSAWRVLAGACLHVASGVESENGASPAGGCQQERVPKGLKKCRDAWPTYCGEIEVPLDRTGTDRRNAADSFRVLRPPKYDDANGTIVAMEGGPGYATTKSRDYYLDLFAPLMGQRAALPR